MPQSLSAVFIHLVFSTKHRTPFLNESDKRHELHAYLGGVSNNLDCPTIAIGGVDDHVHLLCGLGRTISQAEWIKEVKRASSIWMSEQGSEYRDFKWQAGYGDFSVSASNIEEVREYILNQEQHHRRMTYQDEFRILLKKHNLEWDEQYVWD
jgi:putative transposase